jgi:hypothetical protein
MKNRLIRSYMGNTNYLKNIMKDFADSDLMLTTGESNTIGWIFGHIILYRGKVLEQIDNHSHVKENENQFDRGVEKNKNIIMSFDENISRYMNRGEELTKVLEGITDEELKKPVDIKLRGMDLDLEGYISMLIWHETFHIGQIDLIKAAVGKGGIK